MEALSYLIYIAAGLAVLGALVLGLMWQQVGRPRWRELQSTLVDQDAISDDLADDIAAYDELLNVVQPTASSWQRKLILFLLSAAGAYVAFGLTISWQFVPILLGIIFIHEFGHLAAMWLCGYHNGQILFVPFLGAITLGQKEKATPMQEAFVCLMGPLPGLIFGLWVLYEVLVFGSIDSFWFGVASTAIVLNYMNLIPLFPLDGGRVVSILFLKRFPRLQFGFTLVSIVVFAAGAWWMRDPVPLIFVLVFAAVLPSLWRSGTLVASVAQRLSPQADRTERLQVIAESVAQSSSRNKSLTTRFAVVHTLMQLFASPPPNRRTVLTGGAVYAAALLAPLWLGSVYALFMLPGEQRVSFLANSVYTLVKGGLPDPHWEAKLQRAKTPDERWKVLMEAGERHMFYDREEQAGVYLQQAYDIAATFAPNDLRYIDTLVKVAECRQDQGEPVRHYYEKARDHLERHHGPNHLRLADILEMLGAPFNQAIPIETRIRDLERALHVRDENGAANIEDYDILLRNLADAYGETGRPADRIKALHRLVVIYDMSDEDSMIWPIEQLTALYEEQGQAQAAQAFLQDRIDQWRKEPGGNPVFRTYARSRLVIWLGWSYAANQKMMAAQAAFKEALVLHHQLRQTAEREALAPQRNLIEAHLDLCYTDLKLGRMEPAREQCAAAKRLMQGEEAGSVKGYYEQLQTGLDYYRKESIKVFRWRWRVVRVQAHMQALEQLEGMVPPNLAARKGGHR